MKNNKLTIGIIITLFFVIIGLVVFIVAGGIGKESDNKTANTTSDTTEESVVNDLTAGDTNQPVDDKETTETTQSQTTSKDGCYVSVNSQNNWQSGDKLSGQLDISITNNSNSLIKNWSVEIEISDDLIVESFWNCNCITENGIMKLTPVEYNGTVEKSTTLKDIGIIVTVSEKSDFDALMNNAKLLVDGKEYKHEDETTSSQTDEIEQNEDAEKEEAKKEDTQENEKESESKEETNEAKKPEAVEKNTPFDNHGKLSVNGTDIVDKDGNKYQLKGPSTHGIAWFPDYVNKDCFQTFRDDWGANLVRIAMYTHENGGYCNGGDKDYLKGLVDDGVNYATELGMYVIIDWHVLQDLNPQVNKEDAKKFFEEVSSKYKNFDNVIYEICNEPNGGTTWSDVKSYAEEIIPIIRKNAPDAIIIVGTPNWSQDVDVAAQDPISGYENIMYAAHFYAATHTDSIRNKVQTALDSGIPVFISEFSICDASGNGAIDYNQADKWFELIDSNNLSYAGWNISNKDETSSLINSTCSKTSWWEEDELSETGVWLRKRILGVQ